MQSGLYLHPFQSRGWALRAAWPYRACAPSLYTFSPFSELGSVLAGLAVHRIHPVVLCRLLDMQTFIKKSAQMKPASWFLLSCFRLWNRVVYSLDLGGGFKMAKPTSCVVYWLYDDRCVCIWRHGWIGISSYFEKVRLQQHRSGKPGKGAANLPLDFKHKILFRGTEAECLAIEAMLRPHPHIGWNKASGGQKGCLGYKHTAETCQKMSEAAIKSGHSKKPKSLKWRAAIAEATVTRYARPGEREKTITAVKDAFKTIDRSGPNNSMFGKHHSAAGKNNIGRAKREANRRRNSKDQLNFDL